MELKTFLNQAWTDHANDSKAVADRIPTAFSLIGANDDVPAVVQLISHVVGEHLGEWEKAKRLLSSLRDHSKFNPATESAIAIARATAAIEIGAGSNPDLSSFSPSDRVRILSQAAALKAAHGHTASARTLLEQALAATSPSFADSDSGHRALAVTGNNLASSLEQKTDRSDLESELMIYAAKIARRFWELAGGWLEVERAEYRLAMCYLAAQDHAHALKHAQTCIEICEQNQAAAFEFFFAYEALARVESARNNEFGFAKAVEKINDHFVDLSDSDKAWCEETLTKLKWVGPSF